MNKIFFIFFTFLFTSSTFAATGYIDTSATNQAKVCYDTTCTSPTPSIINFELSQEPSIVVDSITGISGNVWGNSLGWIKLNPTGSGVSFSNNTTGLLTGKAWSQVSGWINFAVTGQSVIISPSTGELSGWAWTGGPYGGWIKFDCGDSSSCVRTTWRYTSGGGGGGGGGGGSVLLPTDVCPNIGGNQSTLPQGYTVNTQGQCIEIIDVCPNLPGEQSVIPTGFVLNDIGACIREEFDFCPNLSGIQSFVPSNYLVDDQGLCIKIPKDFCPNDLGVQVSYSECSEVPVDLCVNLPGAQSVVPDNHNIYGNICLPQVFDFCPNLPNSQTEIPKDYIISDTGECIKAPKDVCDNLHGIQDVVPVGFEGEDNNCFFITEEDDFSSKDSDGVRVIALPFIPSIARIASDNVVLKESVKVIDKTFGTTLTTSPYRVDLVSTGIVGFGFIILVLIFIFIIKNLKRSITPSL
jgi:hypothetical protein